MSKDSPHAQAQAPVTGAPPQRTATGEAGKPADEIQYFDSTIAKLVVDEDGDEVEVMSDNLYPGERLKRDVDAERADEKAQAAMTDEQRAAHKAKKQDAADKAAKDEDKAVAQAHADKAAADKAAK